MAADAFTKARLRSIDRLMRDTHLTPSARLVGWNLYSRLNRVTGDAWPSEELIGRDAGVYVRTVRRALRELKDAGYITIERRGRYNRYTPVLFAEREELPLGMTPPGAPEPAPDTGHFCAGHSTKMSAIEPATPDKNVPLSPSRTKIHSREIYQSLPPTAAAASGMAADIRGRNGDERLRDQRGDERLEVEAIRLLSRDGNDGLEIVSRLHEIDGGQPRLRLLRVIRSGTVSQHDLDAARIASLRRHDHGSFPMKSNAGGKGVL